MKEELKCILNKKKKRERKLTLFRLKINRLNIDSLFSNLCIYKCRILASGGGIMSIFSICKHTVQESFESGN